MSERIQRVLDGELPRESLSPAELAELDAYEEAMDGALASLRGEPEPELTRPVMRRVGALPAFTPEGDGVLERLWAAFWHPRPLTLTVRPAYALVLAGLAAVLVLSPWEGGAPAATDPAPIAAAEEPPVLVHFRLEAAGAGRVQLAGDFTGWEPRYTLNEVREGVWAVVVPVQPGVHQYGFLIDGQRWSIDPFAPAVDDGFGGTNSRLDVLAPARRSL